MTRLSYAVITTAAVSLLGVASIASFAPRLIWNASASTPVGFYTIGDVGDLDVTDLVAVDAPEPLATFLSDGGYLPRGLPLLKRVAAVPDIPTIDEQGLKGFETGSWFGMSVPAGTSKDIVGRFHKEAVRIVGLPEIRDRMMAEGAEFVGDTPEHFTAFFRSEIDKWGKAVKASGARPEG